MQIEYKKLNDITPYWNNPRKNDDAVEAVANSIKEFGFKVPIIIDRNNIIVAGHTRYKAARKLGINEVPIIRADDLTDDQIKAFRIADNKVGEIAEWNFDQLELELDNIELDMSLFGFDLSLDSNENEEEEEEHEKGNLAARYIIPPFSVLDTRQGYWKDRKKYWESIIGNASVTRDDESQVTYSFNRPYMKNIHNHTSNFDPVLVEIMLHWFNKPGGKWLDPFGGEQTKGVIAGELDYPYCGVEFRQEQVDYNKMKTNKYNNVNYYCGDSNNISEIIKDRDFDFCFTSPPYYDLEVYSKDDLSALGTYEEFLESYKNIFKQCFDMLSENSFLVLKVSEIRDKKTGIYRNFVADNVRIMKEIGFQFYNDLVLINSIANVRFTAEKKMRNRKIPRIHQNILVFYKGNVNNINKVFPKLEVGSFKDDFELNTEEFDFSDFDIEEEIL